MTDIEKKAVRQLKSLIKRVENGDFDINECGIETSIEESNIFTDEGTVTNVAVRYEIRHTVVKSNLEAQ